MKRTKWWLYTVLIGMIPFAIRLGLSFLYEGAPTMYFLNEVDISTFGLVLIISSLSEIDDQPAIDKNTSVIVKVLLVLVLIFLSSLLGFSYLIEISNSNKFNKNNFRLFSCALVIAAFLLSLSIFYNKKFDNGDSIN